MTRDDYFVISSACRKSQNNKFLHAVRLREMELNFVFLRVGAVRWYRPRAKNGKRQKCLGLVQGIFHMVSTLQHFYGEHSSPLRANYFSKFILAWFSPLYRQSKAILINIKIAFFMQKESGISATLPVFIYQPLSDD